MSSGVVTAARGRYLAWEAGQLAGVSGHTLGQWARRGLIRASVDAREPHVYSFQDVAEAMAVHELLERGVPHADVRRAIAALAVHHGDWPLSDAPLATAAGRRTRVVVLEEGADYELDRGQGVIGADALQAIREQLTRGGWAVRALPDLAHVEVNPDRLQGRPAIRRRRLVAQEVAELAEAPDGEALLRDEFGLRSEEIADARRWWTEVRRLEGPP